MLTIEEAKKYLGLHSQKLQGDLIFDPYGGWMDKSDVYKGGYCIICGLNITEKFCDGHCGEDPEDECTIFT